MGYQEAIAKNAAGAIYNGTKKGQMFYWNGRNIIRVPELMWDDTSKTVQIEGRIVNRTNSVITESTTITNTTEEQTIYTGEIDSFDLRVGNYLVLSVSGVLSNASASDDVIFRLYLGQMLLETFKPAIGNVTNADWHSDVMLCLREVGTSGSIAIHIDTILATYEELINIIKPINTEVDQDIRLTVQWDNALAENEITIQQGILEYKH